MISADEALRIGLVNHVYEPAELLPAAEALAKKIIANAPLAVKFTMEAIERGVECRWRKDASWPAQAWSRFSFC